MDETPGYQTDFLGTMLTLPRLDTATCVKLLNGDGFEIKYTHFSLFQHQLRRLPLLAASNIRGEAYSAAARLGNEPWDYCSQIDEQYQIGNTFYSKDDNTFDRGHIVRRVDPCWGENSAKAEQDTFNWANCTPQHKKLNQRGGIWFQLEQHVMEHGVKNKIADICVFAGPVLDPKDLLFFKSYKHTPVQIPIAFWKVIVWKKTDGKLYAVAFMMSQWEFIKDKLVNGPLIEKAMVTVKEQLPDDYFENLKFDDHQTYQVPLAAVEKATGIKFGWRNVGLPYKAAAYTQLKASTLRKVHTFANVFQSKLQVSGTKPQVTTTNFQAELNTRDTVPASEVDALKRKGAVYTIKKLNIKNITL